MSTIIVIITFIQISKGDMVKIITKSNFTTEVLQSKKVVLLDIWAPWCGPCRAMEPILESVSEELKDKADFAKLDASIEMDLVQEIGVTGLPAFLVFKDGNVVDQAIGMTSKASLLDLVSKQM
jgi:thioredoxin 1